jgi:putative flippase GtrA
MTANFHGDNAVAGIRTCAEDSTSLQSTDGAEVMLVRSLKNTLYVEDSVAAVSLNCNRYSDMRTTGSKCADSISRNSSGLKDLNGTGAPRRGENVHQKCEGAVRMKMFARWLRFNIVSGIGILVQFAFLFLMKSVLHLDYLTATAVSVEAAVVHNFLWHERYTWADRVQDSSTPRTSEAEAQNLLGRMFAALKRCATQRPRSSSFSRLLRFNLTTGGVSIVGNLALMRVMVGAGHMNYFVANGIAIVLCSLVNFLVSEQWVFAED